LLPQKAGLYITAIIINALHEKNFGVCALDKNQPAKPY